MRPARGGGASLQIPAAGERRRKPEGPTAPADIRAGTIPRQGAGRSGWRPARIWRGSGAASARATETYSKTAGLRGGWRPWRGPGDAVGRFAAAAGGGGVEEKK